MKIAQISSIYLSIPPKTHGGTERVVFDLCQHLTKRGHQVELFASGDSKVEKSPKTVFLKHIWHRAAAAFDASSVFLK